MYEAKDKIDHRFFNSDFNTDFFDGFYGVSVRALSDQHDRKDV